MSDVPITEQQLRELECDDCDVGPCPDCGACCRWCTCELHEPDFDLSDAEDERYYWDLL